MDALLRVVIFDLDQFIRQGGGGGVLICELFIILGHFLMLFEDFLKNKSIHFDYIRNVQ